MIFISDMTSVTGATRIYHHWWFTKYSQSGTVIAIGKVAVWSLIYGGCHLSVRCAVGQIVSGHSARFAEWKISIHSKSYWPQRFFCFLGPWAFLHYLNNCSSVRTGIIRFCCVVRWGRGSQIISHKQCRGWFESLSKGIPNVSVRLIILKVFIWSGFCPCIWVTVNL